MNGNGRPAPPAPPESGPGSRPRQRVGLISLGCAKNLVDSEVMLGFLERAGWTPVTDPAEAELVVVNTCGFIGPAREESVQAILEAAEWKKTGRLRRLVVAGCMVQRYADELRANLPEVDAFVGLDELHRVVAPVAERRREAGIETRTPDSLRPPRPSSWLYDEGTPRRVATPPWSAYVKIAEGCDHTCAFCAIPGFRGRFRSRAPESVLREAQRLADAGVRELNLIAQDSSRFGRDLGLPDGLVGLLERLDRIGSLRWIRLHYLYPNTVTPALIDAMARLDRVLDYVDLPLQHAHPATLARMRRGGSTATHLELLGRIRAVMPQVTLRTTLIAGFPGETETEFEELSRFTEEARFDHLGVFLYSHEEGTPAHALPDDVPAEVKHERRERLLAAQRGRVEARHAAMVGRRVEVLVEGAHPETEHLLVGRMRSQAPDVDGQVLLNDGAARPGEFRSVVLTDTAGYDLVGRIL